MRLSRRKDRWIPTLPPLCSPGEFGFPAVCSNDCNNTEVPDECELDDYRDILDQLSGTGASLERFRDPGCDTAVGHSH